MSSGAQAPGSLLLLAAKGARREKKHYVFLTIPFFPINFFFTLKTPFALPLGNIFPHIVVWGSCFFAAPPRSAFRVPPSSSLLQHLSHNISHNNITQRTSHTQRLAYNITHTTSLTTTAQAHTQHHSHNIGCQGVGCTPLYSNITQRTSHTQRPTHNSTHTT